MKKLEEGHLILRSPMFNGKFFTYCKNWMEIVIKGENYQVWRVIEVEDFKVTTKNKRNEVISKPMFDFDSIDYKKLKINANAIHLLYCGLRPHEYNRISMGVQNC